MNTVLKALVIKIRERVRALNIKQFFWILTDQGVVSLGGFFTNILLARNLSQEEYGIYVLIFGILIFLNHFHGSLIIYPLLVKGGSVSQAELRRFASSSLLLTAVLVLPLSLGIISITLMVHRLQLIPWLFVALLFWQFQETTRRALMAHLRYREVLWGDILSYLGQAILLLALSYKEQYSFEAIFSIMAITSGAGAVFQAIQLGLKSVAFNELWSFGHTSFTMGRWVFLGNVGGNFARQAVLWTLAFFHSSKETGSLQAMANVLGVTNPVLLGISSLLVPAVAQAYTKGGIEASWRAALGAGTQGAILVMPYYIGLVIFSKAVLSVFYGSGSPYLDLEGALRLFAILYGLDYVAMVSGAFLLGLQRSRVAFLSQCVRIMVTISVCLPLAAWGGVLWAVVGMALAALTQIVTDILSLRKIKTTLLKS